MVSYGIYYYFAMVIAFSVGLVLISLRHLRDPLAMEHFESKDGDIVVNVSLIARTLQKELGKLTMQMSKISLG